MLHVSCMINKIYYNGRDPFNQNSDRSDREKWSASKGGPFFSKLFQSDRTDPLSFGPKFLEILVEQIAPNNFLQRPREYNTSVYHTIFSCLCLFLLPHKATDIPKKSFSLHRKKMKQKCTEKKNSRLRVVDSLIITEVVSWITKIETAALIFKLRYVVLYAQGTTEKIFESKLEVYDVYVDNQNIKCKQHLSWIAHFNNADRDRLYQLDSFR